MYNWYSIRSIPEVWLVQYLNKDNTFHFKFQFQHSIYIFPIFANTFLSIYSAELDPWPLSKHFSVINISTGLLIILCERKWLLVVKQRNADKLKTTNQNVPSKKFYTRCHPSTYIRRPRSRLLFFLFCHHHK